MVIDSDAIEQARESIVGVINAKRETRNAAFESGSVAWASRLYEGRLTADRNEGKVAGTTSEVQGRSKCEEKRMDELCIGGEARSNSCVA